jgi:hypothetical protein
VVFFVVVFLDAANVFATTYNLLMTGYSFKYKYSQTCLKGHLYIAKHYL